MIRMKRSNESQPRTLSGTLGEKRHSFSWGCLASRLETTAASSISPPCGDSLPENEASPEEREAQRWGQVAVASLLVGVNA